MNKQQLIEIISEKAGLTVDQVKLTFNATFQEIQQLMVDNDSISIPGFGSFGTKIRAARAGRNPRTGEELQIAEATVPFFKAGSQLKEAVNQKSDKKES
jgi:nucleoid DNA-binding protein